MGAPIDGDKSALLRELRLDREQREQPTGGRRGWHIALGVLALCLLIGAASGYVALRAQRFEVEVASAVAPSAGSGSGPTAVLQATGYVTARREATVSAQITGTLKEVLIEEGVQVKAGQVLARLEDTAQRAALAQCEAQFKAATALRTQFEAQLRQARRDLKRNADLIGRNLVSQQALETSQTQVDSLAAQLESQAKQVELAQAQIDGAQVQLSYTIVRAPFSGVIVAKAAQAGEIISPISAGGGFTRTGVGTVVDMNSLEIEVDVNEAYINRVEPEQRAQAVLDAYPDWMIPAHVIAIVPTADRSKATVKVRVAIDQKDPRILPDMGVRVSFFDAAAGAAGAAGAGAAGSAGAVSKGVLVPGSAVVERDAHTVVFEIDAGHAHARQISAGAAYGDQRLVEGVASGAQLVREPPPSLNDGAAVVVRRP
jgi:RND family efflux transporter MFP subunit